MARSTELHRPRSAGVRLLLVGTAFALGCLPSARLVTRRLSGQPIEELGDGNPGASNVRRSLGLRAGLVVFAMDFMKGWLPPFLGRRFRADEDLVGALGFAPVLSHVLVLRGRGAATCLGAHLGGDFWSMALSGLIVIAGTIKRMHALVVLVGIFLTPIYDIILGRSRKRLFWTIMTMGLLPATRLRGPRRGAEPVSGRVLLNRFLYDREF